MTAMGLSALALSAHSQPITSDMEGWEDYTYDISELHFGDNLRATQLDIELVYNRAKAIACAEGFGKPGNRPTRNNNPGNLKAGGKVDNQNHTILPTEVEGWLALYSLLYKHKDETIDQISLWYAEDVRWAGNVRSCAQRLQTADGSRKI